MRHYILTAVHTKAMSFFFDQKKCEELLHSKSSSYFVIKNIWKLWFCVLRVPTGKGKVREIWNFLHSGKNLGILKNNHGNPQMLKSQGMLYFSDKKKCYFDGLLFWNKSFSSICIVAKLFKALKYMGCFADFCVPKQIPDTASTNLRVEVEGCYSSIITFWSGKNEIW